MNQELIQSLLDHAASVPEVAPDPVVVALEQLQQTVRDNKDDPTPVIRAIEALIPIIQSIPKAIRLPEAPEPLETVSVKNLAEVTSPLEAAIKKLQASVEAQKLDPKITVAAPNVKVDAPDFASVLRELANVERAIKAIKFPAIPEPKPVDLSAVTKAAKDTTKAIQDLRFPVAGATPTDPFIRFVPADIDDAGTVQYFGYIDITGGWYIMKYDTSVAPKTIRYATGNSAYTTAFSGRAGLTYSVWSQ